MNQRSTAARRPPGDITRLLHEARQGNPDALERLMPIVYRELRRQAASQVRHEGRHCTLQPTELVHETYLRLTENRRIQWQDRTHFFAVSARLMRRLLVDRARSRHAQKRGRGVTHVTLSQAEDEMDPQAGLVEVLMLDEALSRLGVIDPRQAQVVEMRVFAGLSVEETATALGVSPRTIKSDWQMARAWLTRELRAVTRPAASAKRATPLTG
jgi:RNA polymerase sigma-70 factor (ECF subfamily)